MTAVQVPLSLVVTGPCSWPVLYPGGVCEPLNSLDTDEREAVEQMAVDLLWLWTGSRLGLCDIRLRPCSCGAERTVHRPSSWEGRGPRVMVGPTGTLTGCGCTAGCLCSPGGIVLPGPVHSVEAVRVDGVELSDDDWVLTGDVLSRSDDQPWSLCQDVTSPDTEPGTWSVSYTRGQPVPAAGRLAAGRLACELSKAYSGDTTCKLPQRLQTLTRQGVSMTIMDQFADLSEGRTGIWAIDAWVAAMQMPPLGGSVASPDAPRSSSGRYGW